MRLRLTELAPEWLADGPGRQQMGVRFLCPCCQKALELWFETPVDRGQPVTSTKGRFLYQREGASFEDLSLYPPVRHGAELLLVYEGEVACVE